MAKKTGSIIPVERIQQCIYIIRGHRVILSHDLARLYDVETRVLVQAVKRNIERFPEDFMFQLNQKEFTNLKSQIVISSWGGMRRAITLCFHRAGCSNVIQCSAEQAGYRSQYCYYENICETAPDSGN